MYKNLATMCPVAAAELVNLGTLETLEVHIAEKLHPSESHAQCAGDGGFSFQA